MDSTGRLLASGDRLRASGLRSTPQRRSILAAFLGAADEHLSADEVFSRAARELPGLGRGTVYATLAEYTEVGLLAAVGAPEPVRYELNTSTHAHFRCRTCLRLFDVPTVPELDIAPYLELGHRVDRVGVRAEGLCADCAAFAEGLAAGVRAIHAPGGLGGPVSPDAGAAVIDTELGALVVLATPEGICRVAFPEHGDADALMAVAGRGGREVQAHLADARAAIETYLQDAGIPASIPTLVIDDPPLWLASPADGSTAASASGTLAAALSALADTGVGEVWPYHDLEATPPPAALGYAYGSNPLPILAPCHRVDWGRSAPSVYVGGPQRRTWLRAHEERSLARV